jgi:hypothetical protein
MVYELPDADHRLRCGHCGNLTRFDVVRTQTTHEFWHQSMGGAPKIEQSVVKSEAVASITCRWCGATDGIESVSRPEHDRHAEETGGLGGAP